MASSFLLSPLSSYSLRRSKGVSPAVRVPSVLPFRKPHPKPPIFPIPSLANLNSLTPVRFRRKFLAGTSIGEAEEEITADSPDGFPVGEDSAAFDLGEQKLSSWVYFSGILGAVLFALNVVWIDPKTGFGTAFVDAVSGLSESHEVRFWNFIYHFFFSFLFLDFCGCM